MSDKPLETTQLPQAAAGTTDVPSDSANPSSPVPHEQPVLPFELIMQIFDSMLIAQGWFRSALEVALCCRAWAAKLLPLLRKNASRVVFAAIAHGPEGFEITRIFTDKKRAEQAVRRKIDEEFGDYFEAGHWTPRSEISDLENKPLDIRDKRWLIREVFLGSLCLCGLLSHRSWAVKVGDQLWMREVGVVSTRTRIHESVFGGICATKEEAEAGGKFRFGDTVPVPTTAKNEPFQETDDVSFHTAELE